MDWSRRCETDVLVFWALAVLARFWQTRPLMGFGNPSVWVGRCGVTSFAVILPAAGQSSRFGTRQKKPFVDLKGRAVWIRSLEAFVTRDDVAQALVVVAEADLEDFRDRFKANLPFLDVDVVVGGETRMDSVSNALKEIQKRLIMWPYTLPLARCSPTSGLMTCFRRRSSTVRRFPPSRSAAR